MQSILVLITFGNPTLLFALLALVIPIIVHLFNLRRVRKVEFSNIALLKKIKEESSSKRRPVEILILISRILAVGLLILAFCRPIYKNRNNSIELKDQVLVYLDNSESLSVKTSDEKEVFDKAYQVAGDIVESYPDGTIFRFIENSYSNSIITEFTKASFTDNLTEVGQVGVGRSFDEVLERKNRQDLRGDVYLISDFQTTDGLGDVGEDSLSQYFLTPISGEDYSNVFVDTAFLKNTFLSGDVTNVLKVKLRRINQSLNVINLKLYFGEQLSGTTQLDFEGRTTVEYDFIIPPSESDLNQIRISVDDTGLAFDNDYYVTVNRLEKVRVLEIYDRNSPSFVSSLFEDNELFSFRRVGVNSLDNQSIESSDFVVINEVEFFSNQLVNSISNFLNNGKTVLFIPSESTDLTIVSNIGLNILNDTGERVGLDVPDYSNPFFEGVFEENSSKLEMPSASVLFRLVNEELSYLSYKNGRSFLSKALSSGNLFFFSTSFKPEQTSFTNHAIFVPVMYKLALGSKVDLSNLYYYTDSETVFFPLESQNDNNIYGLRKNEEYLIPDQRQEEGRLIMEIPKDQISAGHYEIVLDNETVGMIAFNLPKAESNVHPVDYEYLEGLTEARNVSLLNSKGSGNVGAELRIGIQGIPLWKYALLGALLFLFVEIILIRYL